MTTSAPPAMTAPPANGFPGGLKVGLRIEVRPPCPVHGPKHEPCKCMEPTEVIERDALATQQFAQLVQLNILDTAETLTDTSGNPHAESVNSAATVPTICAGTGGTAATVTDYQLQTQTETVAATINAYSGSGSSGSFTVTGTITALSNRAYQEVGMVVTVNTHVYLITHDTFSTLNVSNTGTLSVTYTLTFS